MAPLPNENIVGPEIKRSGQGPRSPLHYPEEICLKQKLRKLVLGMILMIGMSGCSSSP